ncbi:hypothetical protein ACVIWV_007288 [Bradyrhizobium diazoefficiens]
MTDDTIPPFSFPAVHAKKVTAAFDGGRLTSNGGVMLLAMAERRLGLADNLARVFPDRRDPTRVVHSLVDMFRARMFAICCGYEDADDLDHLRSDPAFKLACGRLPDTGRDLCSQPTLSRLENAPRLRDVIRLTYTLVDAWMDSYPRMPAASVAITPATLLAKSSRALAMGTRPGCSSTSTINLRPSSTAARRYRCR